MTFRRILASYRRQSEMYKKENKPSRKVNITGSPRKVQF